MSENSTEAQTRRRFGYFDETGDVAPFSGSQYFIMAGYLLPHPRPVELHVKRIMRLLGSGPHSGELKSTWTSPKVASRLLASLISEDLEIYSVVVDKRAIRRPPRQPEGIYRAAIQRIVSRVIERWPRVDLFFDKRYTKPSLFDRLEIEVREAVSQIPGQAFVFRHPDSEHSRAIQAADMVAGLFAGNMSLAT